MTAELHEQDKQVEQLADARGREAWTTAMLVISSVALGGIALALWNRKSLATFRELEMEANRRSEQLELDLRVDLGEDVY